MTEQNGLMTETTTSSAIRTSELPDAKDNKNFSVIAAAVKERERRLCAPGACLKVTEKCPFLCCQNVEPVHFVVVGNGNIVVRKKSKAAVHEGCRGEVCGGSSKGPRRRVGLPTNAR